MDIQRYKKAKASNKVSIHQEGDIFFLDYKKYDSDTGEEIDPERVLINLEDLKSDTSDLESEVSTRQTLINEIEVLKNNA